MLRPTSFTNASSSVGCRRTSPLTRRPGFAFIDFVRTPLVAVDLTAVTPSTPNGGTAADALDPTHTAAMVTTTALGTSDPYVVLEIVFAAPVCVAKGDPVVSGVSPRSGW